MNKKPKDEIAENDLKKRLTTKARRRKKLLDLKNEIEKFAPHLLVLIEEIIEIDREK